MFLFHSVLSVLAAAAAAATAAAAAAARDMKSTGPKPHVATTGKAYSSDAIGDGPAAGGGDALDYPGGGSSGGSTKTNLFLDAQAAMRGVRITTTAQPPNRAKPRSGIVA